MRRRLYLLRHGQTEFNLAGRMQGWLDTELTDLGRAQARAAAEALRGRGIEAIVSSPLRRALDTAHAVGEALGLSVRTDDRLRETSLGQWQGMLVTEVPPPLYARWRAESTFAPPDGESRVDVARRSQPLVDELADASSTLLVAHGGTLSTLTAALLGLTPEQYHVFAGLDNAHWGVLREQYGRWRMETWNEGGAQA